VVKKAIRDLYQRDTEKVIIQGEDAYKKARAVMKLLIPSHVKRIENYKDQIIPLFERYQVEEQIEAVFSPIVNLPSGGYLVINQTEALVAVDVNSGRANRDRDIDATALNTNLEAATEVARQLRLRDLAGLVVIDFIDMDDRKHRYKVEKALKDAVKNDRAKVQTGRISGFGLMEMSRQCIRSSVLEVALNPCPVCDKIGFVRSTHSGAVKVLRALERVGMKNQYSEVKIRIAGVEMLYLLNEKRKAIQHIEEVHHFHAIFERDDSLKVGEFEVIPTTKLTVAEKKQHHHESHDIAASLLDNGKGNGKKKPRPKKKKKPKAKSPTQAKANRGNQPSNKQSNQPTNEVTNKQSNEASNQPTPVAES
jgi:ribonuclease E